MFDKYGFYYTEEFDKKKYDVDVGLTFFLTLSNNKYVVFHKRNFKKVETGNLQSWMSFVTERVRVDFKFDEEFFIYGLTYYQKNLKQAIIKSSDLESLETFSPLYEKFWLNLKLRDYLHIDGNYPPFEEILQKVKFANLNQAVSFILALATLYWDWNLVEDYEDVYLSNVLLKFPFDWVLAEYQDLILSLEDILTNNKIYNNLIYTKKWEFIWNITDVDLLKIMWEFLVNDKVKNFFNSEEVILPIFEKKKDTFKKQLFNDLRINLDDFKLTEIKWIKISY